MSVITCVNSFDTGLSALTMPTKTDARAKIAKTNAENLESIFNALLFDISSPLFYMKFLFLISLRDYIITF